MKKISFYFLLCVYCFVYSSNTNIGMKVLRNVTFGGITGAYATFINNEKTFLTDELVIKNSSQGMLVGLFCAIGKHYIKKNIIFDVIPLGDLLGVLIGLPISKGIVDKTFLDLEKKNETQSKRIESHNEKNNYILLYCFT